MKKVGIIENPRSQQNKRGVGRLEAVAAAEPALHYARLEHVGLLPEILAEFARQDVEVVVTSGGDGTVQAVLTALIEGRPFKKLPTLALLPAGMTNMTAKDIGVRAGGEKGLRRVLACLRGNSPESNIVQRPLLRLENIADYPPQVGMFFGGAGITRAIETCRSSVHTLKLEADVANGLTLAKLMLRWAFSRSDDDSVIKGDSIEVRLDGEDRGRADYLLVLATTLDRLVLGSRPFWNQTEGDIHFTTIAYPPHRLLRSAYRVLYGGPRRKLPEDSYFSRATDRAELRLGSPFTLDGQLFEPNPDKPLILTAPARAAFLRV